jgi:hypothetical protein
MEGCLVIEMVALRILLKSRFLIFFSQGIIIALRHSALVALFPAASRYARFSLAARRPKAVARARY